MPRVPEALLAKQRAILLGAVLALVILAPLPFGAVSPGPVLILELSAAVIACGACWILLQDRGALTLRAKAALVPLGFVVALGLVQLLPLATRWNPFIDSTSMLNRERAAVHAAIHDAPPSSTSLSLSPAETVDALARLISLSLLAFATAVLVRSASQARACAIAISISGALQGLYGSVEYLSGRQQIFGYVKTAYLNCATGTFINRNHFAGYLALSLPFALGLFLAAGQPVASARPFTRQTLSRFAALFCIFCIWSGIVLSTSRGGMAAALLGALMLAGGLMNRRRQLWLLLFALLIPTSFLMVQGLAQPGARYASLGEELTSDGGRLAVWRAATQLVIDSPLWGTGLGTFQSVFSIVQPPSVLLRFHHAHNDWLQSAVEGGIPTLLAFIALLVVLLLPAAAARLDRASLQQRLLARCAAATIAACALHSLMDFSLRIPAVALLTSVVVGLRCSRGCAPDA